MSKFLQDDNNNNNDDTNSIPILRFFSENSQAKIFLLQPPKEEFYLKPLWKKDKMSVTVYAFN